MTYSLSMFELIKSDTFEYWLRALRDKQALARINARLRRVSDGNLGDAKTLRDGIAELRINHGPGYRVYFMRRGPLVIVLLAGGDKRTQAADIARAIEIAKEWKEKDMAEKFTHWDAADYLETEEDMALYFQACVEDDPGDGSLIRAALGDIARARGMTQLAKDTGLAREGLYKALSAEGNPEFSTIMKVVKALGLKFQAGAAKPVKTRKRRQPADEVSA